MEEKTKRAIRASVILAFIVVVIGLLIYGRIQAYSLAPKSTPIQLRGYPLWAIPLVYLYDYFSHAWICLLFAFSAAGLIYEFVPKETITKYMGSSKALGYGLAVGMAPFLTVCSCTMVPLFSGILYAGAGIGPAITFLLMAPASNILAILLTGELISWELAGVRIIASVTVALVAGIVISKTPWGKAIEKEHQINSTASATAKIDVVKPPLDERLWAALKFGGYLAKQILPYFVIGLIIVGYLEAFLPEEIIKEYLTGVDGVFLASVLGGPLYTPTLVEIVLGRGIWVREGIILSKGALLSWLMGQPYDFANALATSKIVKGKVVLTYIIIAWAGSVIFGMLYGMLSGSL
ncbi:MAG: permease [Nitrososphaerota archaeon]|nr:permease [Candidatus Bathyarchaeota archaeon]MDW8023662.1 permease [Nitrososphaerota archaeon]